MTSVPSPDLWQFALACYAHPGVSEHCLGWQDQGADVCLLLCTCWLEQRGIGWSPEREAALADVACDWQGQVVAPLRHLRRAWKAVAASDAALEVLRDQVKALELAAERELLSRLDSISRQWQPEPEPAGWLEHYLRGKADDQALAHLRHAARVSYSAG